MENISIKVQKSKTKEDRSATVTLEGNLTIKNAEAIHKKLLSVSSDFESIQILVSNIVDIDLSVIQLLSSFWKSMQRMHKTAQIDIQSEGEIQLMLTRSGFQELFKIYIN